MKANKIIWKISFALLFVIIVLGISGWLYAGNCCKHWADIVLNLCITIIGAFFGFFAALWLDQFTKLRKELDTKKIYTQFLLRDIGNIKSKLISISNYDDKQNDKNLSFPSLHEVYLQIEFSVWDALISTGDINLFNNEPYFESIYDLSAKIISFNNLQNNIMIGRLVRSKLIIDCALEQKLKEIFTFCIQLEKSISEH